MNYSGEKSTLRIFNTDFSWRSFRDSFSDLTKFLEYLLSIRFCGRHSFVVLFSLLCQASEVVRWQDQEQMSDIRLREMK